MQLFYDPHLDNSVSQFSLGAEESKHVVRVLRKKQGDELQITNGKGYLFNVKLIKADVNGCRVEITDTHKAHEKMHKLHMAVSPTKMNDRFEWFLEKVTEIGVSEITPIICERSERKVVKKERLERVIQSAMKQSLRTFLPKLNEAVSYADFMAGDHEGLLFIAHCENEEKTDFKRCVAADHDITILIGPEGDFSPSEINEAYHKGFLPVSLGEARLRTETAAIVASTIVNLINSA
jgi:16S rRNA (uracil1498-N3)-methyltransferase